MIGRILTETLLLAARPVPAAGFMRLKQCHYMIDVAGVDTGPRIRINRPDRAAAKTTVVGPPLISGVTRPNLSSDRQLHLRQRDHRH